MSNPKPIERVLCTHKWCKHHRTKFLDSSSTQEYCALGLGAGTVIYDPHPGFGNTHKYEVYFTCERETPTFEDVKRMAAKNKTEFYSLYYKGKIVKGGRKR